MTIGKGRQVNPSDVHFDKDMNKKPGQEEEYKYVYVNETNGICHAAMGEKVLEGNEQLS